MALSGLLLRGADTHSLKIFSDGLIRAAVERGRHSQTGDIFRLPCQCSELAIESDRHSLSEICPCQCSELAVKQRHSLPADILYILSI